MCAPRLMRTNADTRNSAKQYAEHTTGAAAAAAGDNSDDAGGDKWSIDKGVASRGTPQAVDNTDGAPYGGGADTAEVGTGASGDEGGGGYGGSGKGRVLSNIPATDSRYKSQREYKDEAGMLASLSNFIDQNARLVRTIASATVVGSAATVAFVVYRRGLHGFGSAAQVPISYFERRKRVRVRIFKVVAARPPFNPATATGTPRNHKIHHDGTRYIDAPPDSTGARSDVILQAEHITLLRRLLRLGPRSLSPGGGVASSTSATGRGGGIGGGSGIGETLTLRLCGISASEEGMARVRDDLAKTLVAQYCDAELLFLENRAGLELGPSGGGYRRDIGFSLGGSGKVRAKTPVAVCHIHRRRGFWRDKCLPWMRLDPPKTGFGEGLLRDGFARFREERWWLGESVQDCGDSSGDDYERTSLGATAGATVAAGGGDGGGDDIADPLPSLKHLLQDLSRLAGTEQRAKEERKGLWANADEHTFVTDDAEERKGEGEAREECGEGRGGRRHRGWVMRALTALGSRVFRR